MKILKESYGMDLSDIPEIRSIKYSQTKYAYNPPGINNMKSFIKALEEVGLDKFKIRTTRFPLSQRDIKDEWMDLHKNGWSITTCYDSSLDGFNEVVVCKKI